MSGNSKKKTKVKKGGSHMDASALHQFLDTEKIAQRVRRNLGLVTIQEKNEAGDVVDEYDEIEDHALMNETGVKSVMAVFRGTVDKNQALSNYSSGEIQNVMMDFHETLVRDLIQNWERYGIQNRSQLDEIVGIVTNNVYSVLKRAEDGMTLEELADSSEEVSQTNIDHNNDNGGLIGGLRNR